MIRLHNPQVSQHNLPNFTQSHKLKIFDKARERPSSTKMWKANYNLNLNLAQCTTYYPVLINLEHWQDLKRKEGFLF